jgi:hypothetical protein
MHCEKCGVKVGRNSRADYFECPHDDSTCESADPCVECREMAGDASTLPERGLY